MTEQIYNPQLIDQPYQRALFEQLQQSFQECEIWIKWSNYGRWLAATVLNRDADLSVEIPINQQGYQRTWLFHDCELSDFAKQVATSVATPSHPPGA